MKDTKEESPSSYKEGETEYDKALQEYLDEGIFYGANSLKHAEVGDIQQLASDSFFAGYKYASKKLEEYRNSNKHE